MAGKREHQAGEPGDSGTPFGRWGPLTRVPMIGATGLEQTSELAWEEDHPQSYTEATRSSKMGEDGPPQHKGVRGPDCPIFPPEGHKTC